MSDAAVTCAVGGPIHDSPQPIIAFLREIAPIFGHDVRAWQLDLSQCTYLGPYGAALLVATYLDARQRGVVASVTLPSDDPEIDAFLRASGVAHFLAGAPLPATEPDVLVPVRVHTEANFNDPVPIFNLVARHMSLDADTEDYLRICVSEVIQNVEDHAGSTVGCVSCAQLLPQTRELRVAIVDRGRGIATSLRPRYPAEISSAVDALQRVILGDYTAKSRPNNMGLGMSNVSGVVTLQLGGELFIVSEDASAEGKAVLPFARPLDIRFPGTGVFFSVTLA